MDLFFSTRMGVMINREKRGEEYMLKKNDRRGESGEK